MPLLQSTVYRLEPSLDGERLSVTAPPAEAAAASDDTVMASLVNALNDTYNTKAKGWGRSGALSDALLTRQGTLEGFLAVLSNPNTSLFIGWFLRGTTAHAQPVGRSARASHFIVCICKRRKNRKWTKHRPNPRSPSVA